MCHAQQTRRGNFPIATRRAHGSAEESETDTPQGVPLSLPAFLQLQHGLRAPDSHSRHPTPHRQPWAFSVSFPSRLSLSFPLHFLSCASPSIAPSLPSDGDKLTKASPLGLASGPSQARRHAWDSSQPSRLLSHDAKETQAICIQSQSFLFFLPHAAFVTRLGSDF